MKFALLILLSFQLAQAVCQLSQFPVDPTKVLSFHPIGLTNAYGHYFPEKHGYIHLKNDGTTNNPNWCGTTYRQFVVDVKAPSLTTVYQVERNINSINQMDGSVITTYSYKIYFSPKNVVGCQNISMYINYLTELSTAVSQYLIPWPNDPANPPPGINCSTYGASWGSYVSCSQTTSIVFSAGTVLGKGGGGTGRGCQSQPDTHAMDFYAGDSTVVNSFVQPTHYPDYRESPLHAICPMSNFVNFGIPYGSGIMESNTYTPAPNCGKVNFDVANTIQGNWFIRGATPPTDKTSQMYSMVYDIINPSKPLIAVGPKNYVLTFPSVTHSGFVNRAFSETTPLNYYCYDHLTVDSYSNYQVPPAPPARVVIWTNGTSVTYQEQNSNGNCSNNFQFLTSEPSYGFSR